ncbi:unnamed protein product [Dibothriocephalus latus]|uniref:Collagen IV NC1 domain-containing protein n=1 Tax=Dibothriocephalus latus TaxID=60516 RepID=A0A3P7MR45_DIBLA|nr:unnamed protein product [Dibothriocephalus latus]
MFIECTAKGMCGFFEEHKHFWLRVMPSKMDDHMFGMVMGQVIKVRQSQDSVGKCIVCMRTKPLRNYFLL